MPAKRAGPAATMNLLQASLKQIHKRNIGGIRKRWCYQHLCKKVRVHAPRIGVGAARKLVDRCPLCVCWDTRVVIQGRVTCRGTLSTFIGLDKKYFDDWQYSKDTLETRQLDDEEWLNSLHRWVTEGRARRGEAYNSFLFKFHSL